MMLVRSKLTGLPIWLLVLLPLGAFAGGQASSVVSGGDQIACTDPRPKVCAMDYTPVCAQLQNGQEKTYSNACSSCADANVQSYRASACE